MAGGPASKRMVTPEGQERGVKVFALAGEAVA
jgi:hypothetical protein